MPCPVTVTKSFESKEAWSMLSCNATVFVVLLAVLLGAGTGVSRHDYEASVSLARHLF